MGDIQALAETTTPVRVYPREEATRDPIFLLQSRFINIVAEPDGYDMIEETCYRRDDGDPDDPEELSLQDLLDRGGYALEEWHTESVWFTRQEAEKFGEATKYRYRHGWRVFCVCAEGELAALLKQHTRPR